MAPQTDKIIRINQGRVLRVEIRIIFSIIIFSTMMYGIFNLREELAIAAIIILTIPFLMIWYSFHIVKLDLNENLISSGYWVIGRQRIMTTTLDHANHMLIVERNKAVDKPKFWTGKMRKPYLVYLVGDDQTLYYLLGAKTKEQAIQFINTLLEKLEKEIDIRV